MLPGPFYIPTSSARGFLFLCTLAGTSILLVCLMIPILLGVPTVLTECAILLLFLIVLLNMCSLK
jgi:hypothetical protein